MEPRAKKRGLNKKNTMTLLGLGEQQFANICRQLGVFPSEDPSDSRALLILNRDIARIIEHMERDSNFSLPFDLESRYASLVSARLLFEEDVTEIKGL
jgi:hypothetical protein